VRATLIATTLRKKKNYRIFQNGVYEYAVTLILLFISLGLLTRISKIKLFSGASWPDPFIYTGFAENYSGLFSRYGATYYGARISTILPTWFRTKFDFPTQEFRIFLLSILALCIYAAMRSYCKKSYAFVLALASSFSILFIRYFSDDYMPGFVVLYTVISIVSLIRFSTTRKNTTQWLCLSGAGFGLALNSNVSVIVILIPWALSYLYSQKALTRKNKFLELRTYILGAISSFAICVFIGIQFGGLNSLKNYKATFNAIGNLKLYENLFTKPVSQVSTFVILYGVLTLLNLMILRKESHQNLQTFNLIDFRKSKILFSTVLSGMMTLVFGLAYYLLASKSWFVTSYYAYLYLPVVVIPILLWIAKNNPKHYVGIVPILISVILFNLADSSRTLSMQSVSNMRIIASSVILIMVLMPIKYFYGKVKILSVVCLIFIAAFPITQDWNPYWKTSNQSVFNGEYLNFLNSESKSVNESTQFFAEEFAAYIRENIPTSEYFWLIYPENPKWLLSIDATQLWGYSCYMCTDLNGYPIARDFPPASEIDWQTLNTRRYSIIFADNESRAIKAAKEYSDAFGLKNNSERIVFVKGSYKLVLVLLDNRLSNLQYK